MTTTKKRTNEKITAKPKRLSLSEIFRTAKIYEESQKAEGAAKKAKTSAQNAITTAMETRKVKSLASDKFGDGHTQITFVQNETVVYNEEELWTALSAAQRRLCFDRFINLNELPADARKRVLEVLTKDELDAVTTFSLDIEKLSTAVQERKIRTKLVAKFASIVKSAPYIRVSHGAKS